MTSLFETLPILDKTVPTVPGKFEERAQDGKAYVEAVRTFLEHMEQRRTALTELRTQVNNVLDALGEQATEEHGQLDAAFKALETAVEEALSAVQTDEGEVKDAADATGKALE